jgi:hypothetical protein
MRSGDLRAVALFLVVTACGAATVIVDAGCNAYGEARAAMPVLGSDPVSAWVAVLDTSMTRVCR